MDMNLEKALVGLTNTSLKTKDKTAREAASDDQVAKAEKRMIGKFLSCRFIVAADKARFANVTIYL